MSKDKRRTHSTIDLLPKELQRIITCMVVDNAWPSDWLGETKGKPTYDDIVEYCRLSGHTVSRSAIGRHAKQLRTLSRMKTMGLITREAMDNLTEEKTSQTQKAVAEMITAIIIETIADNDSFTAKDITNLAKAIKDCTAVAIQSDKYTRGQIEKKIEAAEKEVTEIGKRKKIAPETLQAIKEQIYGIRS